ncbi:MAG: globin domain-containing protein [Pseudomonadota bacterium]
MTREQIEHVNQSWQSIVLMGDTAIAMFYRRLHDIDPSTHQLFSDTDMHAQRLKFMDTFGLCVRSLNDLEECRPMLEQLGRRHAALGVKEEHYDSVREALLTTIESGLGQILDRHAKEAWTVAYERITQPMRSAGYPN